MKKFIKKWGTGVLHDKYMKPIVPPVYKKSINIINSNPQLEEALELWQNGGTDIIIEVDGNMFNNDDFNYIQNLNAIVQDSGDIGEFELGNIKITINQIKDYSKDLIFA